MAVFFGRLTPAKGALDLLQIWKAVESKYPEAVLKIAGPFESTAQRDVFLASMSHLGLRSVILLGNRRS
jgi:glycosyltransferase involved in cell wall biosynthesis